MPPNQLASRSPWYARRPARIARVARAAGDDQRDRVARDHPVGARGFRAGVPGGETVRRKRNATAESTTPRMVRDARVLFRKSALRRRQAGQRHRRAAPCPAGGGPCAALGRVRIVGDHQDRLAELSLSVRSSASISSALFAVEVAGRLVGDDDLRVGDDGARDRDPLLLTAGELPRVVVHPVLRGRRARAPPATRSLALRLREAVSSSGSSTFSTAVSTGIRL